MRQANLLFVVARETLEGAASLGVFRERVHQCLVVGLLEEGKTCEKGAKVKPHQVAFVSKLRRENKGIGCTCPEREK